METRCVRIKLKPDSLDKVRAWQHEITTRKSEAIETLKNEGVVIESVFLDEVAGEHYLIYFMKEDDLAKSQQVAKASTMAIDAYHKQFKKDCWQSVHPLEQLIDLDLTGL